MRGAGEILVVSCYELGHQPLAVASTVAFLRAAGFEPRAVDLAVQPDALLLPDDAPSPRLVLLSVPMHTALHIGVRAAERLRRDAPRAHRCFFGLYAALNAEHLLGTGLADSVAAGEVEPRLVGLAETLARDGAPGEVPGLGVPGRSPEPVLERLSFPVPARDALPTLDRYAELEWRGERRRAAAIETSRGCRHRCRHCPLTPVYDGRFFVVSRESVLEDARRLAADGVRHLTFADPDFLNGPGHSLAVARAIHREFPTITFDVTTKIELLLRHATALPELADLGCVFVVSAVESLSDTVLDHLGKGHTRADVFRALERVRAAGIALRPSFVAFTPWTGLDDYLELLDWIDDESLVDHVDPVQLSIRLLVPPGSPLATATAMRPHLGPLEPERFAHGWRHPDPRMDRLQASVERLVQRAALDDEPAHRTFRRIDDEARRVVGRPVLPGSGRFPAGRDTARPPRLTEPWFC